jgi:hypothetical protein
MHKEEPCTPVDTSKSREKFVICLVLQLPLNVFDASIIDLGDKMRRMAQENSVTSDLSLQELMNHN